MVIIMNDSGRLLIFSTSEQIHVRWWIHISCWFIAEEIYNMTNYINRQNDAYDSSDRKSSNG